MKRNIILNGKSCGMDKNGTRGGGAGGTKPFQFGYGCRHGLITFSVLVLLLLSETHMVLGGNCWLSMNRNGRCTSLVKTGVSREECCDSGSQLANSATASWSDGELLTPSSIFFMHVQGGVPCTRCKATCDGVQCADNQKCVLRNGLPKCVCSPNCAQFKIQAGMPNYRGFVCGSDGRTYKSPCRLLKRACRKKETGLTISYYGPCRTSCAKVTCPGKKRCLLDQNMRPHCVNCTLRKCPDPREHQGRRSPSSRAFCGVDEITYPSMCHLRQAACRQGKAIPVAYRGFCRKRATCENTKCLEGQTCLREVNTRKPRCVTCSFRPRWCKATPGRFEAPLGPICSTNGKTYKNWCDMTEEACSIGTALDTKHFGECMNSTMLWREDAGVVGLDDVDVGENELIGH